MISSALLNVIECEKAYERRRIDLSLARVVPKMSFVGRHPWTLVTAEEPRFFSNFFCAAHSLRLQVFDQARHQNTDRFFLSHTPTGERIGYTEAMDLAWL